jgi:hypothetical protein
MRIAGAFGDARGGQKDDGTAPKDDESRLDDAKGRQKTTENATGRRPEPQILQISETKERKRNESSWVVAGCGEDSILCRVFGFQRAILNFEYYSNCFLACKQGRLLECTNFRKKD